MAIVLAAASGLTVSVRPALSAASGAQSPMVAESAMSPVVMGEPQHPLMAAIDAAAADMPNPERARRSLLWRMAIAPHCYADNMTAEQLEEVVRRTWLWPAASVPPEGFEAGGPVINRFYTDSQVWTGDLSTGSSGLALRAHLTYSFPADGTTWGLSTVLPTQPNQLNAKLTTSFGSLDRGREYIRAGLAAWRRSAGLTYTEVADDDSAQSSLSARSALRGDIRIGGYNFAASPNGTLAYNAFPTNIGVSSAGGGDMVLNSSYFLGSNFTNATADFVYFRNTIAHEHGHGLGFIHSVPCNGTKIMEPTISITPRPLMLDEVRAAGRNYGDRYSGNHALVNAFDLGNLTTPAVRSVILRELSTNVSNLNLTDEDFFKFTIDTAQTVVVSIAPTGDTSTQGQQSGSGCSGTTSMVNALACGNLNLQVLTSGGVVIATAPAQPIGSGENVSLASLAAGTYVVFVKNSSSEATAGPNQYVQTYDMTIRVGSSFARPDPIAGLHKRVQAGQAAFFNGSVNSRVTESGASIPITGYDWDLDGNGTFETVATAQPTTTYVSNGVFPVTLRVTDTNGMSATDTINVTVFGATTAVASVSPSSAPVGTTAPITIFGANLRSVTSASQVTVSGTGVSVTGTPLPNQLGTQVSGLSLVIAPGAAQTVRDISITNSDGQGSSGTGVGVFTVGSPPPPPANDECAAPVSWGNSLSPRPFNNTSGTTGTPQSFPSTGCPASGPIANDVWYVWTSPTRGSLSVTTDSASQGFSSRVAMYRTAGCPPVAGNMLRCEDFGGSFSVPVLTGSVYLFQVGSTTAGQTGAANVLFTLTPTAGACCAPAGCSPIDEGACQSIGGEWTFQGTCATIDCPDPTGACCEGTTCTQLIEADCLAIPSAQFRGLGVACGTTGNPVACCPANINGSDGVGVQDLFDFLAAWFAQTPVGDFNKDLSVTLQDLFDYLFAYFQGCP